MTQATSVKLEPHFFAPKVFGLVTLGGIWAIAFSENKARDSLQSTDNKLKTWASSFNIGSKVFPVLGIATAALGYVAYKKTEEKDYLYGSIAALSILPLTLTFMNGINRRLMQLNDKANVKGEGLDKDEAKEVEAKVSNWVGFHRLRVLTVLLAVGCFFVAENKALKA